MAIRLTPATATAAALRLSRVLAVTAALILAAAVGHGYTDFDACQKDQFQCSSEVCIPLNYQCDGYIDCQNRKDEVNCTALACPGKYLCPQGGPNKRPKCINKSQLCDGHKDCDDNADEEAACSTLNCPSLECQYNCQASSTGGACYCPEGEKISNDSKTCIDRDECSEWGLCEQLCENTEGSYACGCHAGYELVDRKRCVAGDQTQPLQVYFAQERNVMTVDARHQNQAVVANATMAGGMDYHYAYNTLFWSDAKPRRIRTARLLDARKSVRDGHATPAEYALPGAWDPVSVAVDWVGHKLYAVDAVGRKVDVFELNGGRWHAVALGGGGGGDGVDNYLADPSDVALDPARGLMFVADGVRLVRARMDGSDARAVVADGVYNASGVAVDAPAARIYWCDSALRYVETADYDGGDRRPVIRGLPHAVSPSRLAVFEGRVYWSDDGRLGVFSAGKYGPPTAGTVPVYKHRDVRRPKSVKVVHPLVQREVPSPCSKDNAGCMHMCIVTKGNDTSLAYRCACTIGFQLTSDMHNCTLIDEFLLYSQVNFIKGKVLNKVSQRFNDAILPVASREARFVGLDFDARENYIYYSDVVQDVIYRIHKNGTGRQIFFASQMKEVEGLAVDWVAKNLYFIDSVKETLSVLSIRNVTNKRVLVKKLRRPRAIVVHPNKGYIFFSDWDWPAKISRAHTDGSNLIVFANLTLGWPNGLAVDFTTDRLYWCDAILKHVQHSTLDGTDVKTINSTLFRHPFSIVTHHDWLYISDWKLNAIIKMHKVTGAMSVIEVTEPQNKQLYNVKIYSVHEQRIDHAHPCSEALDYGGCQKLCFAVPSSPAGNNGSTALQVRCGCPYGEKLDADGKTCVADPITEPPVIACPKKWDFTCGNMRCIHQSWVCDGHDDCLDNSDEKENCTSTRPTCASDKWQCGSGRCVPRTFRCDGENDCDDSSDETGCTYTTCSSTEFRCNDGLCIPSTWKCDSQNDCNDGSDEGDVCAENIRDSIL